MRKKQITLSAYLEDGSRSGQGLIRKLAETVQEIKKQIKIKAVNLQG